MKAKFNGILTLLFALLVQISFAQEKQISGTVSDGSGPLPGVSVIIKGTSKGTQTNFDGVYQISAKQGDVLVFSYVGMKAQEATVAASTSIDVKMQEDANVLDEVIVVAYGTAKKSDYTGAATQIESTALESIPFTTAASAIEGASAGVTVNGGSGQPGASQDVRIRGFGSFSASSSPLYVVDGIAFVGDISSINPSDIESITILKDASSTSLYGNKAANGVVMITTKRGKNKKGEFYFNASSSIVNRSIPEYDRLGPDQYYEIMWEALRNGKAIPGVNTPAEVAAANIVASNTIFNELFNNPYNVANNEIVGTDGKINPNASLLYGDDLDWEDAIVRTGYYQNYDLNYQGSTDSADYYVSLGYVDQEGYIENSDYSRFAGRMNVNYQAASWFKTGLNIGATTSQGNQAQAGEGQSSNFANPIRFTRNIGPIYNIHEHDASGGYIYDEEGNKIYDLNAARPSGASPGRHVVAEVNWDRDYDEITSLSGRTYFDFKLYEGLTLTINATLDQSNRYTEDFNNKYVGDGAPGGAASRTYDKRSTVGFNQLLNYNKTFGENHNFKVLLAHESLKYKRNYMYGRRTTVIADGNTELINFVNTTSLESFEDNSTDESYFGRLNYDYKGKYFLSGSYRSDGTSKFASDKRWGDFWSLGVSWRIDKESFMENTDWVDLLKFRASYGELGNNSGISFYAYQGLYDLGYNNQSESGILQASLQAPDLQWEKSASYDLALEFRFWDRFNGTLEYYYRESDNLLFDVPLPLSSGVASVAQNIGTLFNKGFEVSLDYDIFQKQDFNWNFGVILATIENEFTKLPQEEIINGSKKLMVGHSLYDYWLRDWYGVDPADGAALYVPTQDAIDAAGPDIRTVDGQTLTTTAANAEYHYAGTAIPDLTGAITNSFRYKNFNLDFMFTYQMGGESIDYNYQGIMSSGTYGTALSVDILDRWQQPGDITDIPRMDPNKTTDFNSTSDRWLVDASYFNLKRVNFRYAFPDTVQNSLGVSDLQMYVNAENVFSLNARKGLNLQEEFNGTTSNVYTPSRVMTLGVIVKF